ncbi:uncharacterized protein LOC144623813 [Crassostrea virginica]
MVSDDKTNKKLYTFLKNKKSDGSGVSPLRSDETLHSTPSEKADILNKQFSLVFTTEDVTSTPNLGPSTYCAALDSLQTRRLQARATMMYHVVNNLIELLTTPMQPAHNITRGHSMRFIQPSCNIRCYQDSFYPAGISIWDALPQSIIISTYSST